MIASSIPKSLPAPKKLSRGLTITTRSTANATMLVTTAASYNVLIALLLTVLYPVMSQANFATLLASYMANNVLSGMIGAHLTNFSGFAVFLGLYLYSAFNGVLYGGIVAYIGGAALPRNIESGMLDLALARPISRTRYYLETWLSVILCGMITALFTIAAAWLATLFIAHANLDWQWVWITQLIQLAFYFLAGGIGMLLGSFINASRTAAGAAVGLIALGYLLNTFGALSDKLSWLLKFSPFYYAPTIDPLVLHQITTWWHPWVLVIAGLVCGVVGLIIFNKRDLPTV